MRGGVGQALDALAGAEYERERRDQLRGNVGAELGRELLEIADLAGREPEYRRGVGAAAAETGGDRDPLLDLDPQRRAAPAPGAEPARARSARFSPASSASQRTVSASASSTTIRSASASGSNSEQSSWRPSWRRGPR